MVSELYWKPFQIFQTWMEKTLEIKINFGIFVTSKAKLKKNIDCTKRKYSKCNNKMVLGPIVEHD